MFGMYLYTVPIYQAKNFFHFCAFLQQGQVSQSELMGGWLDTTTGNYQKKTC